MSKLSQQLYDLQCQRADAIHQAILIWLKDNSVHPDTNQSELLYDVIKDTQL